METAQLLWQWAVQDYLRRAGRQAGRSPEGRNGPAACMHPDPEEKRWAIRTVWMHARHIHPSLVVTHRLFYHNLVFSM